MTEARSRPWQVPSRAPLMRQSWQQLLFAHWPLESRTLAPLVPAEFPLDVFAGQAWLGVVPFYMTDVALRAMPALPWMSSFPELNVRTYVRVDDKPGVFFFSLDAGSRLAVLAARWAFGLPYFAAEMTAERASQTVRYRSRRRASPVAEFVASYRPDGPAFTAPDGSLEYFLTERYCLYACDRRARPYRLEIDHRPWLLHPASAEISTNTMARSHGIELPNVEPLVHFVERQDVIAWSPDVL